MSSGWLALAADPAPLLGPPPVPRERDDDLLRRRDASFAAVQEHYYPDWPRIERGWRHHLAVTDGGRTVIPRAVLDYLFAERTVVSSCGRTWQKRIVERC
jgi:hypothetical protein